MGRKDIGDKYNAGDYKSIAEEWPNIDALVELTPSDLMRIAWAHHYMLNATIKTIIGIEKSGKRALIIGITDEVLKSAISEDADKISAFKLKPLHLLGLGFEKEAMELIQSAISLFPEDSGIWNTKALLEIYGEEFEKAVATSAVVIGLAVMSKDFRTAGNGSRQMAIAVKEATDCIFAAAGWLNQAIDFWRRSQEQTGWDAKIHINGAVDLAKKWGCTIR